MSRLLGGRANTSGMAGPGVALRANSLKTRSCACNRHREPTIHLLPPVLWGCQPEHRSPTGTTVQPHPVAFRRSCRVACSAADAPVAASTYPGHPSLQVTRSNFAATLPAIKQALQDCQFFSFDCEMTGLFLPNQDDHLVDDVDDRYVRTAAAAEQFLVAQFGLSFFQWTSRGYEARSFNFHLFPSPDGDMDLRFMSQASALAFLASEGFDFNKVGVACSVGSTSITVELSPALPAGWVVYYYPSWLTTNAAADQALSSRLTAQSHAVLADKGLLHTRHQHVGRPAELAVHQLVIALQSAATGEADMLHTIPIQLCG